MRIGVTTIAFSKNEYLKSRLLSHFSNVKFNHLEKRLTEKELIEFLKDIDIAIIGLDKINHKILNQLPNLKAIVKYGVGLDNIDVIECKKRGIFIGWEPGVNKLEVAEITIGFMIAHLRNIFSSKINMSNCLWIKDGGKSISEIKIGIIGLGNIGKSLVELLKPFGAKIIANDIEDHKLYCNTNNILFESKEYIYENCDIISIHTPLNESTKNMISKREFSIMKKHPFIINTARGGIVDEVELENAIIEKKISGAAIDVFENEPIVNESLCKHDNVFCTPHISGNSNISVVKMGESAINFILEFNEKRKNL